jgi:undecaprenyl-phosphate galactose phosphotransferase
LRKSSIDELPQILNVLKGDMSIVGPRPLVEGELEDHGGSKLYWKVKPGITGWWGSHGRSDVSYDERLELEYYYIRHLSFKLDVICFFKTITTVIRHKGAV